jgi:biotin synthase
MSVEEIIETVSSASEKGFKALVLQSGEDLWYDKEKLVDIVKAIRENFPMLVILSIGEREPEIYKELYERGARGVLLRFETGNKSLYEKLRPGHIMEQRINLIKDLRKLGYLIFTGFLIGLPGQKEEDIFRDIELTQELGTEMFSFGPFIPHPDTPLGNVSSPSLELVLQSIARTRIMYPQSKILVTTALESLDRDGGRRGLLSGANSLMIDVTPIKYRRLYELYPNRAGAETELNERIDQVLQLLYSLGRAPTDLGIK